jgi:galactitol-specific phosphotransferase system IIB component
MKTKITEGLRPNDLKGMLQNIVSVDEYKSKIDDAAIVIAFYASSKEVAADTNRFIQKSYVDLLDTEVSAAPNQEGYYLVFVEMMLNNKTASAIANICRELSSLTDDQNWKLQVRGDNERKIVPIAQLQTEVAEKLHNLLESVLQPSGVQRIVVKESGIEAFNDTHSMKFVVQDQGSYDIVYARNNLAESAVNMSSDALRGCRMIKSFLGSEWNVECLGESYAVHNTASNHLLLISFG